MKKALISLAVIILSFWAVSPANAHTDVTSTSPAAGETVGAGEQLIRIEFSEKVLELADSTEIVVIDSSGEKVHADCTGVDEKAIYTNAFLPTEGAYEVVWRTVSEDGHAISGKFTFSVDGNAETEYVTPACATDTPTVEPTPKVIATPMEDKPSAETKPSDSLTPVIGSGLAVLGVAVFAWLLFRKKAQPKE